MHYVYMLKCADGSYYTGYAKNLLSRLIMHMEGKGAKYTRYRLPVTLVYYEHIGGLSQALSREKQLQKMNRKQKEGIIMRDTPV